MLKQSVIQEERVIVNIQVPHSRAPKIYEAKKKEKPKKPLKIR